MRPLFAAALALAHSAPAIAQLVPPEPVGGYLVVPSTGPSTQVLAQPGGTVIVTPGWPAFTIVPESYKGFEVVPESYRGFQIVPFSGDPPEDEARPCCPGLPIARTSP